MAHSSSSSSRKLGYLIPGILAFALLAWMVLAPLLMVFAKSFHVYATDTIGLANWQAIGQSENLQAVWNSLKLGFWVTIVSSALAIPTAYFLSRTSLKRLWWLDIVLMIPFMIPPYINSLGWILFMQRKGIVWRLLPSLQGFCQWFFSFPGMVWIMSMHTYPFLMTKLKNAFSTLPSSIDDAARVYGRSRGKNLWHVYAPLVLPNYLIGAFLVFVKALSEYGTPATFGTMIKFTVFTTIITDDMQVAPIDFGKAASLASVLVTICMLLWALQSFATDKLSYPLMPDSREKGKGNKAMTVLGSVWCILLFLFSAGVPLLTILLSSFKVKLYKNLSAPGNFTFESYRSAFEGDDGFGTGWQALGNTVWVSLLSSFIVLVLGLLFAIYARRHRSKFLGKGTDFLSTLPQMVPNIVMAIGLIMLYNGIYKIIPVYRTPAMLVIGYSIVLLPSMFLQIKNSLTQMPESLLEAGSVFSKHQWQVDLKIVVPLAIRGALYGFVMTYIVAFRELMVAKLLQPPSFYTLSLFIDMQFEQGSQQSAMAVSVVSVGVTLLVMLPLEFFVKKRRRS